MQRKFFYNPNLFINKYGIICFVVVTFLSVELYSLVSEISFQESFITLCILFFLESILYLFIWIKNKNKQNYVLCNYPKVRIVENNRLLEYDVKKAKLIKFIPHCFEVIKFDKNTSLSSIHFTYADFTKLKKEFLFEIKY